MLKRSQTDVAIIGAGPVGLVLAHFLGRAGVNAVVLEMDAELSDEPRAVGLDPESLRTLASLDLLDVLQDDILFGLTGDYLNGEGELLFELGDDQPGPLGFPNMNGFNQPALVRTLAAELARYEQVNLAMQHELVSFVQDDDGVTLTYTDANGTTAQLQANYLIGCDGGRSMVRKALGIEMQGASNPLPWLVIDTRERHPDQQRKYRFFCDPARPGMFIQTPHANRRWEWMVLPGEDRERFLQDDTIHDLISPHVNVDDVEVYRRRVYDFHAIIADRFAEGRVFLAGDAAHMTPPFAGQGLNSGLRDAANLGWKLAWVIQHAAPSRLLDTYQSERWAHARELIDMALNLGNAIQPIDVEVAQQRDAQFAALQQDSQGMLEFQRAVFKPLVDRSFTEGAGIDVGTGFSGRMIIQPMVRSAAGESVLLDNLLGSGFALLGLDTDPAQLPAELLSAWCEQGLHTLQVTAEQPVLHKYLGHLLAGTEDQFMLLRPDRFCMATFDTSSAAGKLAAAGAWLGMPTH